MGLDPFAPHPILEELAPWRDDLYRVVSSGYAKASSIKDGDGQAFDISMLSARCWSDLVNSCIIEEARQLATSVGDDGRLKVISEANTTYFRVNKRILIRFKRMDERGRTKNLKTKRSDRYDRQESLDCVGGTLRIDVGYVEAFRGGRIDILVSCKASEGKVAWTDDLLPPIVDVVAVPAELAPERPAERRRRLVVPEERKDGSASEP